MPKYKTVNPLSMIPKREDLPEGRSLYEVAKTLAPNVVKEFETPYNEVKNTGKLLYNAAMGEDAEGLPFGAEFIPGVSLTAKLKQGKTPGLFDILDVPSFKGLTGLKTLGAMVPIGTTLAELQQGKRMGKSLRNIEKAKDARKYITTYHKTRNENVPNIDSEGLKLQHPTYGVNTTDSYEFSPMIWLSGHPTSIPVLRRYGDGLDETTTYKVKIPRKEFYETPRMMMPQGRGGQKVMAAKGEPSWSKEGGKYIINTYGKDIPPEYLTKMDYGEKLASVVKTDIQDATRDVVADLVESGEIPGDIVKKYGVPPSEKFIRYGMQTRGMRPASKSELGNIVQDEMRTNFPPVTERRGYGLAEAAAVASDIIKAFSSPKYNMSPFNALFDAMNQPFHAKTPPFKSRLELAMNPPKEDPKPKFRPGAVSRGINSEIYSTPKDRAFNWAAYKDSRALGYTPQRAAYEAVPRIVYKNGDPTDPYYGYELNLPQGAISRGETPSQEYTQGGFLDAFSQSDKSRALEKVFSSKSLSRLKSELEKEIFKVPTGSITRGDGFYHTPIKPRRLRDLIDTKTNPSYSGAPIPLKVLHKKFFDEYLEGVDPSILNDEWFKKAKQYADKRTRQTMHERVNP